MDGSGGWAWWWGWWWASQLNILNCISRELCGNSAAVVWTGNQAEAASLGGVIGMK